MGPESESQLTADAWWPTCLWSQNVNSNKGDSRPLETVSFYLPGSIFGRKPHLGLPHSGPHKESSSENWSSGARQHAVNNSCQTYILPIRHWFRRWVWLRYFLLFPLIHVQRQACPVVQARCSSDFWSSTMGTTTSPLPATQAALTPEEIWVQTPFSYVEQMHTNPYKQTSNASV